MKRIQISRRWWYPKLDSLKLPNHQKKERRRTSQRRLCSLTGINPRIKASKGESWPRIVRYRSRTITNGNAHLNPINNNQRILEAQQKNLLIQFNQLLIKCRWRKLAALIRFKLSLVTFIQQYILPIFSKKPLLIQDRLQETEHTNWADLKYRKWIKSHDRT